MGLLFRILTEADLAIGADIEIWKNFVVPFVICAFCFQIVLAAEIGLAGLKPRASIASELGRRMECAEAESLVVRAWRDVLPM